MYLPLKDEGHKCHMWKHFLLFSMARRKTSTSRSYIKRRAIITLTIIKSQVLAVCCHRLRINPPLLFPAALQLLSDSQINMVKVVNSVSDALNAMQKENVGLKARVKADLQRAPVRGARLKGCSNGKTLYYIFFNAPLIFKFVSSWCASVDRSQTNSPSDWMLFIQI